MIRILTLFFIALIISTGIYLLIDNTPNTAQETGNPSIGGPFTLTTTTGETVTNESFLGDKRLVYFGFTYCPDICPMGLAVMESVVEQLGENAPDALFITIDPARDTQEALATYMQNFPAITGLTGTQDQIAEAAKSYRIYYRKVENAQSPDDYTMDHTSLIYLMNEKGEYLAHYSHTISPEDLLKGLAKYGIKPAS